MSQAQHALNHLLLLSRDLRLEIELTHINQLHQEFLRLALPGLSDFQSSLLDKLVLVLVGGVEGLFHNGLGYCHRSKLGKFSGLLSGSLGELVLCI